MVYEQGLRCMRIASCTRNTAPLSVLICFPRNARTNDANKIGQKHETHHCDGAGPREQICQSAIQNFAWSWVRFRMAEKYRGALTITAKSMDFEHLPLRKAFLKALAPAGRKEEKNTKSKGAVLERSSRETHTRYSKPLFLREAHMYAKIQQEIENGLRGTKRTRMSYEEEEEELCRFVTAKQLLEDSGVVLQPAVITTTTNHQNDLRCQFQTQGCPRCKNFRTEDIYLHARKAIESTFNKYYRSCTNAEVGTSSFFSLSSLGDLLLNCRDDISTIQNLCENLNSDRKMRQRIFLRRMLSPMVGYCLHCEDTYDKNVGGATLVDVLLQVRPFQPHILGALIQSFRILSDCRSHTENRGDFTSLQVNDLFDLITRHIEKLTCLTCDSIKMVYRSDGVTDSSLMTNGKKIMEQIKEEPWWQSEAMDMKNNRSKSYSAAPLCDKSILKIFHQLNKRRKENGDQNILERLSHEPSSLDRSLLRSVRMQVLEQSLADVEQKSRYIVSSDDDIHEKVRTTTAILKYKKDFLAKIRKARSAVEKRICLWSDEDELLQPTMRSSRISRDSLFLKRDQVAEERATSSVEVFLDATDISREDFLKHTIFMDKVNRMFTSRNFDEPGQSCRRPALRHIQLSEEHQKEMLSILFDDDGSLKNDIVSDIDFSAENDPRYIDFGNTIENGRQDRRYQIGIKKPIIGGRPVKTRLAIERLFIEMGIITSDQECLDEIGLLVGGTEDQSLHHDIARKFVHWYDEPKSENEASDDHSNVEAAALVGWEVDRLRYNKMISSQFGPAAVLISLGNGAEMLLGIQKDQILRDSKKSMDCTIFRGDGKRFRIVRENDSVVVISVRGGVLFTGEFPHCGVRNFKRGTREDSIMEEVSAQVSHFIEMFGPQHRISRDKAIINMFCNLKGMNRLTRLHCSVVTRDRGLSQIPFNMIGYANCYINERDDRCLQNDKFSC